MAERLPKDLRIKQIIEIGKGLIIKKGFNFTAKEISQKMGVSETLIYRIYPSKKEIINAIYKDHFQKNENQKPIDTNKKTTEEILLEYGFNFYRYLEKSKSYTLLMHMAMEGSGYRPDLEILKNRAPELENELVAFLSKKETKEAPEFLAEFFHSLLFQIYFFQGCLLRKSLNDDELKRILKRYVSTFINSIYSDVS